MALHRPLVPQGRSARDLAASAPCPEKARPYVLAATILGSALAFIDGSIVTVALPAIQRDLGATFATLQWVVNAYALVLGSLILIGGSAGDRFGHRRLFITGIAIFALASIGCAFAPGPEALIAARVVQGAGAALMIPQSLAIIAASFPKEVRGRAIGLWAGASAITTAFGPPLGGFLIDYLDWRAAFWINVPLSMIVILLTLRYVPESRNEAASGALDWIGGILAALGFGALTLALTVAAETGGISASVLLLLAFGFAAVALFVLVERRAMQPLVPLSLFRNKAFTGANLITVFLYGSFSAALFLLPFELIGRRGYSASETGIALLPMGLLIGLFSPLAAHWAERAGPRWPLIIGSAIVTLAAGLLALNFPGFVGGVFLPVLIMAAGMAIVVAPLTTAVLNAAPVAQSGAASGVNNAASRLAGVFALAIVGSIVTVVFYGNLDGHGIVSSGTGTPIRFGQLPDPSSPARPLLESAFLKAYRDGMLIAAAFGLLAVLTGFFTIKPQRADSNDPESTVRARG